MSLNINSVILAGRLTGDPTSHTEKIVHFGLAVNRKRTDKATGQKVEDTVFVDCDCFVQVADIVRTYCKKGSQVAVEGSLKLDRWQTKQGEPRQRLIVVVNRVHLCDQRGSEQSDETPQATPALQNAQELSAADDVNQPPF